MSMTKKHFETIATAIKDHRDKAYAAAVAEGYLTDAEPVLRAIDGLTSSLASEFGRFNPLFDRGRFMRVAGFDPSDYAEGEIEDDEIEEAA
jgi:hypothetical protein